MTKDPVDKGSKKLSLTFSVPYWLSERSAAYDRKLKLLQIWRCVETADINRLAWSTAGRGPANNADSVTASLAILMRYWGSELRSAAGPPGGQMQADLKTVERGGNPWQQDEMAGVRHSAYQGGRWLNSLIGMAWNVFKDTCRKMQHIRKLFPGAPAGCGVRPLLAGIPHIEECGSLGDTRLLYIILYFSRKWFFYADDKTVTQNESFTHFHTCHHVCFFKLPMQHIKNVKSKQSIKLS